jgi:hypothetical protein
VTFNERDLVEVQFSPNGEKWIKARVTQRVAEKYRVWGVEPEFFETCVDGDHIRECLDCKTAIHPSGLCTGHLRLIQ